VGRVRTEIPQSLNDFLELYSDELRRELQREEGVRAPRKTGDDEEFSQRIHAIYQEFLAVVQDNLEGTPQT